MNTLDFIEDIQFNIQDQVDYRDGDYIKSQAISVKKQKPSVASGLPNRILPVVDMTDRLGELKKSKSYLGVKVTFDVIPKGYRKTHEKDFILIYEGDLEN